MTGRTLAALLLLAVPAAAWAQTGGAPASAAPRSVRAARLDGDIRLDGRLDEAAWAAAEAAGGFTQSWPNAGAPASKRTEARVLYDGSALYVGVRADDAAADSVAAQLARRDASGIFSDWIHVGVDSYHDRRTAFRFSVNPRGVQKDVLHSNDTGEDLDWDAVWQVGTHVDSAGWSAEFRIPLSQLRYGRVPEGTERVWGFQVQREIARLNERDTWAPWTRTSPGYVSQFGDLTGLVDVRTVSRLELLPYTSARLTSAPPGPDGDPFFEQTDWGASVGADVKYGLTADLTLTAAINPDFGQVEVDPAVVNLSAFETFFPEKRPFFLEGTDIFRFGQTTTYNAFGWTNNFFYSRRIGRGPQGFVPDAVFSDPPTATTILGAAKLTGKTAGGWSIGVMDAVTAEERARYEDASGVRRSAVVEPLSNYFIGRVRRDLRGGRTVVGAMASGVNRRLDEGVLRDLLRRESYVGGLDFEHAWANRTWVVSGYLAGSRVAGSEEALLRTQSSSARYFQRPDADRIRLEEDRTSLGGSAGALAIAKQSGAWVGSFQYQEASPGFESNDLSFQSSADRRGLSTLVQYRRDTPASFWQDWNVFGYMNQAWNFDGDRVFDAYTLAGNLTLRNFWGLSANATWRPEQLDDRLTRGGPLAGVPSQWSAELALNTDARKRVSGSVYGSFRQAENGEAGREAGVYVDVRPSSNLRVRLEPRWSRYDERDQFVQSVGDPLAAATFGRRYVFANVEQTTVSVDTRVDWTFTPSLSLQLFLQPFVSSADFSSYKEFLAPRELDFAVYGRDAGTIAEQADGSALVDPDGAGPAPAFAVGTVPFFNRDFTLRSLRGNAVLRWEYRPGSALFFVWQQQRAGLLDPQGEFDLGRDADLFRDPAENVFLIKATYWLGR